MTYTGFFDTFSICFTSHGSILSLASPSERPKHLEKKDWPCKIRKKQAFLTPSFKVERANMSSAHLYTSVTSQIWQSSSLSVFSRLMIILIHETTSMTVVDCLITLEDDPPNDSKEMMVSIWDLVLYLYQVPQKSPRNVRRIRFEASEDIGTFNGWYRQVGCGV